jgi:hypothetical protein
MVMVAKVAKSPEAQNIVISRPVFKTAVFKITGTAPLVIHRISKKLEGEFLDKIRLGSKPAGKKKFAPQDPDEICDAGRYYGETNGERWEGFNAAAIRCALISACRLCNFKMTIAKMSVFCVADGRDILNPLYSLVRIHGDSKRSEMMARTETGVAMLTIRPMYFPWSADVRLRWDASQFSIEDLANLLMRAGQQVGIGEGRPDSKNSAGMEWGLFEVAGQ